MTGGFSLASGKRCSQRCAVISQEQVHVEFGYEDRCLVNNLRSDAHHTYTMQRTRVPKTAYIGCAVFTSAVHACIQVCQHARMHSHVRVAEVCAKGACMCV